MKKIILLLVIIGIVFVVIERQKLFVRDPLGSVMRNGVKEPGAQVYINFNNEVMIENDNSPMYVTLIQKGQPVGTPAKMSCIHYVACLMDGDKATLLVEDPGSQMADDVEEMTSSDVKFKNIHNVETVVKLK